MNDSKVKKKQTMDKQYRKNRKKKQSLKKAREIKENKHKVISDDTHIGYRKRKDAPKKVSSVDPQKIKKKSSSKFSKKSRPRNHDVTATKKDQQSNLKTKKRVRKKKVSVRVKNKKQNSRNSILRKNKSGFKIFVVSLLVVILLLLSSLGIIFYFFNDKYKREIINNEDMVPYLVPDEEIFVEKNDHPSRFDIVAYHSAEDNELTDVGRVIGLPGDTVEYLYDTLYINDREYEEPYLPAFLDEKINSGSFSLVEVPGVEDSVIPPGYYLILGDNRNEAQDSRVTGLVPQTHIIGIVRYRYGGLFHLEKIAPPDIVVE